MAKDAPKPKTQVLVWTGLKSAKDKKDTLNLSAGHMISSLNKLTN